MIYLTMPDSVRIWHVGMGRLDVYVGMGHAPRTSSTTTTHEDKSCLTLMCQPALGIFKRDCFNIWIAIRTGDFGISLLGWSSTLHESTVDVTVTYFASLNLGYYLAYAAGVMCIFLALFRNTITGRAKLSA